MLPTHKEKKQSRETVYILGDLDVAPNTLRLKRAITSRFKEQKKTILRGAWVA